MNADDYGKQCGTIDAATEAKLGRSFMATLGLLMILLAISAGLYRMQSRSPAAGEQHHSNVVLYLSVIGRRVDAVFLHEPRRPLSLALIFTGDAVLNTSNL